jgi:hypothetical protein
MDADRWGGSIERRSAAFLVLRARIWAAVTLPQPDRRRRADVTDLSDRRDTGERHRHVATARDGICTGGIRRTGIKLGSEVMLRGFRRPRRIDVVTYRTQPERDDKGQGGRDASVNGHTRF